MADLQLNNQTNNDYTFGPYHLAAGIGQSITVDTTTSASLYLIDDAFADIVNQLVAGGQVTVQAGTGPTPFPRVTGVPQLLHGDGTPEGVHFAPQGSAFMRRDNSGSSNALYAKTSGPSLSTGWQPLAGTSPTPSTTLPGSPSNGQQAILTDSTSAPTWYRLMQYNSSAAKWILMGSPTLFRVNGTYDLVSSVTESSLISGATASASTGWQIPANIMGANGALRVTLVGTYLNNSGGAATFLPRVKFGGTSFYGHLRSVANFGANRTPIVMQFILANLGATNSNALMGLMSNQANANSAAGSVAGTINNGVPDWFASADQTIDTTVGQYLDITAQHGTSAATISIQRKFATCELL